MEFQEQRAILIDAGKRLLAANAVQGTWGNFSIKLDEKRMLITPTGMNYEHMDGMDMAIVDIQTLDWSGKNEPSSESYIHSLMYLSRKDIGAVVHTHPVHSGVWACARKELSCSDEEMREIVGGDVKVAAYAMAGTKRYKNAVVEAMKGRNACFIANHGILCVGKDMDSAIQTITLLETQSRKRLEEMVLKLTRSDEFSDELLDSYFLKMSKYKKDC